MTEKPKRKKRVESSQVPNLVNLFTTLLAELGSHPRDIDLVETQGRAGGLSFFTTKLPAFGNAFMEFLETGDFRVPPGWKTRDGWPIFLSVFTIPLRDNIVNKTPSDSDADRVYAIRQICFFAYKAQTPDGISAKAEEQAVKNYKILEAELSERMPWEIHPIDPILFLANELAREIFRDFSWDELRCSHGPGTVANLPFARKYDTALERNVDDNVNYQLYGDANHFAYVDRLRAHTHSNYFRSTQTSEFRCVPKDSRGPRTICREPAVAQFAQQGIRKFMEGRMENHPLTRGQINFEDQTINGRLARYHSATQLFSTIDLKDASDRVSLPLVKRIFDGTQLLEALLKVRSGQVELPTKTSLPMAKSSQKEILPLVKFAPMGSAVCFTTLAFTIWSLLYSSLALVGREDLSSDIFVYGDDIVVPSECFDQCISILEYYGLKANKAKSYDRSLFRESCGVDAYNGKVVTPIRLRFTPENSHLAPGINCQLASFTSTIHQLWDRGLFYSASYLGSLVLGHFDLPPATQTDSYIGLPSELLGITKRDYWVEKKGKRVKKDGTGRRYIKGDVLEVVSAQEKTSESEHCFLHRVILPSIGSDDEVDRSSSFRRVETPHRTHVALRTRRVLLD